MAQFSVAATGNIVTPGSKRSQRLIHTLPLGQQPGLTYQWRRNSVPLNNGGNISGVDTPTLIINPATSADVNTYDVVISGSCSPPATSNTVSLSVNGYALSPDHQDFALAGGNGSVDVITVASCDWTAVSNNSFIQITSGSSGSGNGTVTFTVDAAGANRTGTMTVAGKTFTVNQAGVFVAPVIISEFRLHGSAGPLDEFIELYNNSDAPADISGYSLQALTAGGTPTIVFTLPGSAGSSTTLIPARSHYLIVNNSVNGYSLASLATPDATYTADIVDGSSIGLFQRTKSQSG